MHYSGEDIMPIFFSFNVSLETITYETLVDKFDEYFSPKKNIAVERHNFFKRKQESNETIDKFVTGPKNLSLSAELDPIRGDIVKSVFTCNLHPNNTFIKEKLLLEGNKSLHEIVELAKSLEITKNQVSNLTEPALERTTH